MSMGWGSAGAAGAGASVPTDVAGVVGGVVGPTVSQLARSRQAKTESKARLERLRVVEGMTQAVIKQPARQGEEKTSPRVMRRAKLCAS